MHIDRLKPATNLDDLARTLSDMRPERGLPTRFALVTAKGEGQTHGFVVAADKASADWQLLKSAGPGSIVTLAAKEANGTAVEMSGKVERLVHGRGFGAWATSYLTRVLGAAGAFAVGGATALYGFGGRLLLDGTQSTAVLGVFGLVALAGVVATYPHFTRETDNRDYARRDAEHQYDGAGVEGTIKSVEKPAPVVALAALPPPTEALLVIPFELARTPALVPAKSE